LQHLRATPTGITTLTASGTASDCQLVVKCRTGRCVCALRQAVGADGFDVQNVTGSPARYDVRLTGELHVAAERRAEIVDIDVRFLTVVPPHDLLTDPTGYRQRNLAIAFTCRRRFEFCDAFLEICAAVPPEIGCRCAAD